MKIVLFTLYVFIAAAATSFAQLDAPTAVDWQKVRSAQPDGLRLQVTLPKNHFYRGEVIDASLVFTNTSSVPYHLWTGTYDRSGRITDIGFRAHDAASRSVSDPLAWYFASPHMGGGIGGDEDLGTWMISLAMNQWLRFDEPGVYTLYAWSNRIQKGRYEQTKSSNGPVALVSDEMQITIEQLPPEMEKEVIAKARADIAAGGASIETAVTQLRYLDTGASCTELIALLSNPETNSAAYLGLIGASNPAAEAAPILAAVALGKLPVQGVDQLYSMLKTYELFEKYLVGKAAAPADHRLRDEISTARAQARDEIVAAAIKASGGKGAAYMEVLLMKFQQHSDDPANRAELVAHQLELSEDQANGVLANWDQAGGQDFLPLARKFAGAPTYSTNALAALEKSGPDEAQALLVADARLPKSKFFDPPNGFRNIKYLHLNPTPLPELDAALRAKLADRSYLETTFFYIEEYGTPALLPDVIACYQPNEGKWTCDIERCVLQYWMRCDPPGGVQALARAVKAPGSTGCYKDVLANVLGERWNAAALPLLVESLDDPRPDVVISAVKVLAQHADATFVDRSIAALERTYGAPSKTGPASNHEAADQATFLARDVLESNNWHFSAAQKQRLEVVAVRQ